MIDSRGMVEGVGSLIFVARNGWTRDDRDRSRRDFNARLGVV